MLFYLSEYELQHFLRRVDGLLIFAVTGEVDCRAFFEVEGRALEFISQKRDIREVEGLERTISILLRGGEGLRQRRRRHLVLMMEKKL